MTYNPRWYSKRKKGYYRWGRNETVEDRIKKIKWDELKLGQYPDSEIAYDLDMPVWAVTVQRRQREIPQYDPDRKAPFRAETWRVSILPGQRFRILDRDDYTCQYCGMPAPKVKLHVDHIIPVSKGGGNVDDNLVTSCTDCNLGKSGHGRKPPKTIKPRRPVGCRL
jgi:5-methylcytosine-specific restriction endonuclease McrA